MYSHDQVPIEMCSSLSKTVNNKGLAEVYDCIGYDKDVKRFYILIFCAQMLLRADKENLSPPHVIFHGTFKDGDDWHDSDEISKWDERVVVSFRKNPWVDAKTHKLGLQNMLGPTKKFLEK